MLSLTKFFYFICFNLFCSTHETAKLGIRNPEQDLEESLEQPTSPEKEPEKLSYELLDNLKSLA